MGDGEGLLNGTGFSPVVTKMFQSCIKGVVALFCESQNCILEDA